MEQSHPSRPADSLAGGEPGIPRWQIWVGWLLVTAVGVALGFPSRDEIWGDDLWGVFPAIRSQATLGLTMGMAQSLALLRLGCFRRRSLVDLQWIAATVAGMLLGGFATGIARVTLSEPVRVLWDYEGAGVFWELSWPFLCGLAVGAWMGHGLAGVYMAFYRFPYLEWSLSPMMVSLAAGFAVLAGALGTVGALRRVFAMSPAEAMRPEAPPTFRRSLGERLG
ncbi:MAG: hypothetical protein CVV17_06125, partial [Gammaproteobacteria bacterium HGW-Gammaproteobacteria-7]